MHLMAQNVLEIETGQDSTEHNWTERTNERKPRILSQEEQHDKSKWKGMINPAP